MSKFKLSTETIVAVLALGALVFLVYNYSNKKFTSGMQNSQDEYAPSNYASTGDSAHSDTSMQPSSLLPKDGAGEFKNMSFLSAEKMIGTVSSACRKNGNQQLRSDPVIAKGNVGPWQNSTIEHCNMRRDFEIGSGGA